MTAHGSMVGRQQQTATMVPEHIMGKAVLKMNLQEVQQFIETQCAENPALVMEEESRCPACGCMLSGDLCPACGASKVSCTEDFRADDDSWQERSYDSSSTGDADYYEPFARIASPKSLCEHLNEQARLSLEGEDLRVAESLIDYLDEDGYLREPLIDISRSLSMSVPQLETVLHILQTFDPPGVGARDLRECLLLQLSQSEDDSCDKQLAEQIVSDHWDALSRMKLERIATALKVEMTDVTDAVSFLRDSTSPRPADAFHDPWDGLSPQRVSRTRPDVVVLRTENGFAAQIPDPLTGRVAVEDVYSELFLEMSQKKTGFAEKDRVHIKECVLKARALIEALEFRKSSLRKVIDELMDYQADYFAKGPLALKPITKKELAQRIGLHESTVCRATQDKTIRLPSGEVIEFDVLFDAALPVRELVREFAAQRLSDGAIAEKLSEVGIQLARRTVAKYRDQLGVLPLEYRLP